jgi:hypothetical protein
LFERCAKRGRRDPDKDFASIAVIAGANALMFGGTSAVTHIKSGS